jgi:hypothetical protein
LNRAWLFSPPRAAKLLLLYAASGFPIRRRLFHERQNFPAAGPFTPLAPELADRYLDRRLLRAPLCDRFSGLRLDVSFGLSDDRLLFDASEDEFGRPRATRVALDEPDPPLAA